MNAPNSIAKRCFRLPGCSATTALNLNYECMRQIATHAIAALCIALLLGCASLPNERQAWVEARGGLDTGNRQDRVAEAACRLVTGACGTGVSVRVLQTEAVSAWCWPDGEIFLTSGLVDRLDDAEIAAAVAHELGHLVNDRHISGVASLGGASSERDAESRADLTGIELLEAQQIPGDAMVRMLTKVVRSGARPASALRAMQCRIDVLNRRCAQGASAGLPIGR